MGSTETQSDECTAITLQHRLEETFYIVWYTVIKLSLLFIVFFEYVLTIYVVSLFSTIKSAEKYEADTENRKTSALITSNIH